MLSLSLLLACASDEPAPTTKTAPRVHNAAVPDAVEADDERGLSSRNREPIVRVIRVKPAKPSRLDTMEVNVNATDPENEELSYTYEWKVNGQRVPVPNSSTFVLADYERGDTVQIAVRVDDGTHEVHGESELYTIGNADPQFEGKPTEMKTIEGTRLVAVDPDGDPVTFRMEGAPRRPHDGRAGCAPLRRQRNRKGR